jgi:hypothetical protein
LAELHQHQYEGASRSTASGNFRTSDERPEWGEAVWKLVTLLAQDVWKEACKLHSPLYPLESRGASGKHEGQVGVARLLTRPSDQGVRLPAMVRLVIE